MTKKIGFLSHHLQSEKLQLPSMMFNRPTLMRGEPSLVKVKFPLAISLLKLPSIISVDSRVGSLSLIERGRGKGIMLGEGLSQELGGFREPPLLLS